MRTNKTAIRKGVHHHANKALEASAAGNREQAMEHLRYLLDLDGEQMNPVLKAHRSYVCGQLAESREEAILYFTAAKESFGEAGNMQGVGVTLLSLSRIAANENDSLKVAKDAEKMFLKAGDRIGLAKAQSNIGACHIQLGEYVKARTALEQAVTGHEAKGDVLGTGIALLNLSVCYQYLGDCERAYVHAEKSVLYLKGPVPLGLHKVRMLETHLWRTGGWKPATRNCGGHLANAYINFGNSLRYLGAYDEAVVQYLQGEELSREGNEHIIEAIALNQIGEALREKGDSGLAEEFFCRSRDLFEQRGVRGYEYAVVLQSIGEICCARKRFVEASRYYSAALKEFKSVGNSNGQAEVYLRVGQLYITRENYRKAIQVLEKSLNIGKAQLARDIIVRANRMLGSATMHSDPDKARDYLSLALTQAVECGMKAERMNTHRELSRYHKLMSHPADALYHIEQFIELQQEIYAENRERDLRNAEILNKVARYRKRVQELETRVQSMQRELEEKNRVFAVLSARIIEKEEFVASVEKKLEKIIRFGTPERGELAQYLLDAIRTLDSTKHDWEYLAEKFLLVHQRMLDRLISLAPSLMAAELQVCVLVRLGFSAGRIGEILRPGEKGAEKWAFNHRQRIRGKLGLANQKGISLETFLLKLDVGEDES